MLNMNTWMCSEIIIELCMSFQRFLKQPLIYKFCQLYSVQIEDSTAWLYLQQYASNSTICGYDHIFTVNRMDGRASGPHTTRPLCLRRSSVIVTQFDTHCGARALCFFFGSLTLQPAEAQWNELVNSV